MHSKSIDAALVLSGGVARGLSHIGIYKALCELNVNPKIIAGTSAGAIIGAFIAKGFHADEIEAIASKTNIISIRTLCFRIYCSKRIVCKTKLLLPILRKM